ncbi:MAG: hypothetical protein QF369_04840 [Dehalococcoidales bacterium]|jgi:hypothetical protein|nr:hypothetical protein [Dehalococcoidales bacterium]MDP6501812.1 hypothetical protein [Dehalococcoidales bacterium]|tara:strand:+ start:351 stop:686 length:336 start_codon:yes stop_codon:yes gene_type:complete
MKRVSVTEENAYGTALDRLTGSDNTARTGLENPMREQPPTSVKKLSVFLNRQEDAYLETLGSMAKFSGGKKLSKTRLIETMVRAFSTTELDVRGVNTSEELFQRLTAQLRK